MVPDFQLPLHMQCNNASNGAASIMPASAADGCCLCCYCLRCCCLCCNHRTSSYSIYTRQSVLLLLPQAVT
jgi:hypothetical protein